MSTERKDWSPPNGYPDPIQPLAVTFKGLEFEVDEDENLITIHIPVEKKNERLSQHLKDDGFQRTEIREMLDLATDIAVRRYLMKHRVTD